MGISYDSSGTLCQLSFVRALKKFHSQDNMTCIATGTMNSLEELPCSVDRDNGGGCYNEINLSDLVGIM